MSCSDQVFLIQNRCSAEVASSPCQRDNIRCPFRVSSSDNFAAPLVPQATWQFGHCENRSGWNHWVPYDIDRNIHLQLLCAILNATNCIMHNAIIITLLRCAIIKTNSRVDAHRQRIFVTLNHTEERTTNDRHRRTRSDKLLATIS